MKILIYDKIFDSNLFNGSNGTIYSPSLSDIARISGGILYLSFNNDEEVDCIGVGNTSCTQIIITNTDTNEERIVNINKNVPLHNGLYTFDLIIGTNFKLQFISQRDIYVGRLAIGKSVSIGVGRDLQFGLFTTNESRETLSGQVMPGSAGYSGRRISVTAPYQISEQIYEEFYKAYATQISRGYPLFINFSEADLRAIPNTFERFYGKMTKQTEMILQNRISYKRYNYNFEFKEAF